MKREFQVGDKCRIRQWDDMEAEFGLNSLDEINCRFTFTKLMKSLCGRPFTVRSKHPGGNYYDEEGTANGWSISADMLEYMDEVEDSPIEVPELPGFLL